MNDELRSEADTRLRRRRLSLRRARCLRIAKASSAGGVAGVVFLCLQGMKPAAVTIPVMLVVLSLLSAAASAALFARVAKLYIDMPDPGEDDEDGGPGGGGPEHPPGPPGGGNLGIDWEQFELDFRAYCERIPALR